MLLAGLIGWSWAMGERQIDRLERWAREDYEDGVFLLNPKERRDP
jgi:hypothetical protein